MAESGADLVGPTISAEARQQLVNLLEQSRQQQERLRDALRTVIGLLDSRG